MSDRNDMTDHDLTERLRRTLETEAATVSSSPDAWERFQADAAGDPVPLGRARRGLRFGVPAGALGLAATVLVAVLVARGGGPTRSTSVAAPPTTVQRSAALAPNAAASTATTAAASAATAAPTRGAAAAPAAPTGSVPLSVTFVSPDEGWVLGQANCDSAPCRVVEHTTDGGRTWSAEPGPASTQVAHVRFADASDGWVWGTSELWSTHDGGAAWARVSIPGLATAWSIEDLEASAGVVHVAVTQDDGTVRLADTPVTSDHWSVSASVTLGAGPVPSGQIVLQGAVGWFVQVDRTVIAGARLSGATWHAWTPPCATAEGPAVLAASSATELVAACDVGLWSTPQGQQLFVSHDGGTTWIKAGAIPLQQVSAVATPIPSTVVVDEAGLLATFDGGQTWSTVAPAGGGGKDLGFTTKTQGVAIVDVFLVMTHDGGHTWTTVRFS